MMSFTVLSLIYFVLISLVIIALVREKSCEKEPTQSATVIVCARNEEDNIPGLVESLKALDYPEGMLEIFLVDDVSEDRTGEYIDAAQKEDPRIRAIHLHEKEEGFAGKKNAITQAVGMANGEIILLTDADCRPGPNWVKRMVACFDEDTGMVLGFSPIEKAKGLFQHFLEFDCLARVAIQAGGAFWNVPPYSTARNLAFKRRVFFEVNGYESSGKIATGDDFFLTRDVWLKTHRPFRHAMHPESFVMTKRDNFSKKYVRQQLRRNGTIFHLAPFYRVVGLFVLAYYVAIPISIFTLPTRLWAGSLVIKTILEWGGMIAAGKRFGYLNVSFLYPLFILYYPLHVFVSSVIGSLKKYE
ncbi:MAG: glycosyltransferase [Candidatus Marinimicrobia bacterium]|nr:glycosyltransferase [Candidatus Neomarinimicrobiota bacterium]